MRRLEVSGDGRVLVGRNPPKAAALPNDFDVLVAYGEHCLSDSNSDEILFDLHKIAQYVGLEEAIRKGLDPPLVVGTFVSVRRGQS